MSHGNGADLGSVQKEASELSHMLACHVLVWEYPGYGIANGRPSEDSVNRQGLRVIQFVESEMKCAVNRIVLYGVSIGTGPACYLAAHYNERKKPFFALVLRSPFTSMKAVAYHLFNFLAHLMSDRWENVLAVKKIHHPLLLIHGKQDTLIPLTHSQTLYADAVSSFKRFVPSEAATHNNWNMMTDVYLPMMEFLKDVRLVSQGGLARSSDDHSSPSLQYEEWAWSCPPLLGSVNLNSAAQSKEIKESPFESKRENHFIKQISSVPSRSIATGATLHAQHFCQFTASGNERWLDVNRPVQEPILPPNGNCQTDKSLSTFRTPYNTRPPTKWIHYSSSWKMFPAPTAPKTRYMCSFF